MKKYSKIAVYAVCVIIFSIGYLYFMDEETNMVQTKAVAPVRNMKAKVTLAEREFDKTKLIEEKEMEALKDDQLISEVLSNDTKEVSTAFKSAIKSPGQSALEELKTNRKNVPSYKGKKWQNDSEGNDDLSNYTKSGDDKDTYEKVNKPEPLIKRASIGHSSTTTIPVRQVTQEENTKPRIYSVNFDSKKDEPKIESIGEVTNATLKAVVVSDHNVEAGSVVRFRLLEEYLKDGQRFPRNTIFYGIATLQQNRVLIRITEMPIGTKNMYPVNLTVYDADFKEGLRAKVSPTKEQAVEGTEDLIDNTTNILSAASPIASVIGNGVSSITRAAVKGSGNQSTFVQDGYNVYVKELKMSN